MPLPDLASLWDFGDPAASERRFRELLAEIDPAQRPHDAAEVLSQIARAEGLQRRFDAAWQTLARAESILDGSDSRARVRIRLERGRIMNTSGDASGSVAEFEPAWAMAKRLREDALAVDAAHMLGIVVPDEGGHDWNMRALRLAESSADPAARRWTASLRNNIGWWLHDRGRLEEALGMFTHALAEREQAGRRGDTLVARWMVARCLRSMTRFDEALKLQRDLAADHAREGSEDGYVQEELGECLLALGKPADAAPHFRRAHELLSTDPHLAATAPERLQRISRLAEGGAGAS